MCRVGFAALKSSTGCVLTTKIPPYWADRVPNRRRGSTLDLSCLGIAAIHKAFTIRLRTVTRAECLKLGPEHRIPALHGANCQITATDHTCAATGQPLLTTNAARASHHAVPKGALRAMIQRLHSPVAGTDVTDGIYILPPFLVGALSPCQASLMGSILNCMHRVRCYRPCGEHLLRWRRNGICRL